MSSVIWNDHRTVWILSSSVVSGRTYSVRSGTEFVQGATAYEGSGRVYRAALLMKNGTEFILGNYPTREEALVSLTKVTHLIEQGGTEA